MNFGYPFTPYASNMTNEQYMGNVGTNMPNMGTMNTMDYMQTQTGCGCGMGAMQNTMMQPGFGAMQGGFMQQPLAQGGCNQVVQQTCAVDMPYYVNYNMHVVNNVVRRHIQIPVYTQTQETVYFDEWQTGCGCGCNR